jgi:REP element-mobilizing transposase RayT
LLFHHFYFVGWIDVFTRSRYSDVILESLEFCLKNIGLEVFEFVIMPSHVHLIVRRLEGNLSDVLRDMKSFTAKKILKMILPKLRNSLFMSLTLLASLANFTLSCLFVSPIESEKAEKSQRFFLLRNLGSMIKLDVW